MQETEFLQIVSLLKCGVQTMLPFILNNVSFQISWKSWFILFYVHVKGHGFLKSRGFLHSWLSIRHYISFKIVKTLHWNKACSVFWKYVVSEKRKNTINEDDMCQCVCHRQVEPGRLGRLSPLLPPLFLNWKNTDSLRRESSQPPTLTIHHTQLCSTFLLTKAPGAPLTYFNDGGGGGSDRGSYWIPKKIPTFFSIPKKILKCFCISKFCYLSSGKVKHANFNFGFGQKQNYKLRLCYFLFELMKI